MARADASCPSTGFVALQARANSWRSNKHGYGVSWLRYRVGDLGQIYPISRGASPVLITLGAAVFAGESITPGELLGIALGTGGFIAAYSVVDGIGARLSGAPLAYTVWMCALWGVLMPVVYIGLRDTRSLFRVRPGTVTALVGGLVSLLAYGMVIYAMNEAPLGAVSALRETSVLFAALIGYVFLGETLTARRILACVVIASGTLIIG